MRKTILLLALGMFLGTSVVANACDKDKASVKGAKSSCCMKGAKAAKTGCTDADMKACAKKGVDCTKEMKAAKNSTVKKDAKKS